MRFKAVVQAPGSIIRMLTALNQMASNCLLVICPECWKFNVSEKFVQTNHPQCYSSLPVINNVFSHYIVESKSNNCIILEINIRNLLSAFKSVKDFNSGMTVLKLTKKNGKPLLSFEMWQDDGNELRVNLIQDVPVKPIAISKMYLYEEPSLGKYDAHSKMPDIKSFKLVCEKMKIISKSYNEEAEILINSNLGKLLIQVTTDLCQLKTVYQKLNLSLSMNSDGNNSNLNSYICAKINLKYLLKVILSLIHLNRQQTIITITKNQAVTIHSRLMTHHYGNNNNNNNNSNSNSNSNDDDDDISPRITFYLCVYVDENDDDEDAYEYDDDDLKDDIDNNNDVDMQQQDI